MAEHYQGFTEKQNVCNPSDIIQCNGENCPRCDAYLKKEYTFDRFGDVTLQTYDCRCPVVTVLKFDGFDLWVCDNYSEGEGVARATKADMDAKYGGLDR